jgi:hypothetical protein
VRYVKALLTVLGLATNEAKSSWDPAQRKKHLGLIIDTLLCTFTVPLEKLRAIRSVAKLLLSEATSSSRFVAARKVAKICGMAISVNLAFRGSKFFTRELFNCLKHKAGWGSKVRLTNQAYKDLRLLSKLPQKWNGQSIWASPAVHKITSDASDLGWGAVTEFGVAHGFWSPKLRVLPIVIRELWAVYFGISAFARRFADSTLHVEVDASAVYFALGKMASPSGLMPVLRLLFWLLERHHITIIPGYVRSADNVADGISRLIDREDLCIADWLWRDIEHWFGPHTVDRFASATSALLPRYNSRFHDPHTEAVDAFGQDWSTDNNFVHPPASLLPRVLAKLLAAPRVRATVVVPDLPSQPWYRPLLLLAHDVRVVPAGT